MPTVLDVLSAHRAGLGTFSQFRPFNSFPFFPTCIFLVVDSVSNSCLSSTRPKPAAAPLPSTQKRTRKKLKLEARCNAEQSISIYILEKRYKNKFCFLLMRATPCRWTYPPGMVGSIWRRRGSDRDGFGDAFVFRWRGFLSEIWRFCRVENNVASYNSGVRRCVLPV